MKNRLLTRNEFRNSVFLRDGHRCVVCGEPAVDAHHITERRLFSDGGYYLDNGVSVCEKHHILCEQTVISTDEIRNYADIKSIVLPSDWYDEYTYDKWGNIQLSFDRRIPGPLFDDESVQKVLKDGGVLHQFIPYIKYPRSMHLPWSGTINKDDRVLPDDHHFHGQEVVVTTKMDGENTSMYRDYIHARSIDMEHHESRSFVKNIWNSIRMDIPAEDDYRQDGSITLKNRWRICGENLFALHSIPYHDLPSYFLIFSIWNDKNSCLSWDETVEWSQLFEIPTVPVLYRGIYDRKLIEKLWNPSQHASMEGYVVRLASSFHYSQFSKSLAKFVRPGHVQTKHNWKTQAVIKNTLG